MNAFSRDILGLDVDLYYRLMLEGDVGAISNVAAVYTLRPNSMSFVVDIKNDIKFVENILEISNLIKNRHISSKQINKWIKYQTKMYFNWRSSIYLSQNKYKLLCILYLEYFKRVNFFLDISDFFNLFKNFIQSINGIEIILHKGKF